MLIELISLMNSNGSYTIEELAAISSESTESIWREIDFLVQKGYITMIQPDCNERTCSNCQKRCHTYCSSNRIVQYKINIHHRL